MAYFHCLIGGGSSGGGVELTVSCGSVFAGTTIACTDGITTLTQTCSSTSPYQVVFEIPNGGDWTISGVVSGHTVSTEVEIPTTAALADIMHKTITIYSAKEDIVSYNTIYGDLQTEVFASGETSKQITVDIYAEGSSITFISGVAKEPSDLSLDYSKTFTIDNNTTEIYLMPTGAFYWWGWISDEIEECSTANGWGLPTSYTYSSPVFNTNNIYCDAASGKICGIGKKTTLSASKVITVYQGVSGGSAGILCMHTSKTTNGQSTYVEPPINGSYAVLNTSSYRNQYFTYTFNNVRTGYIYALWYE